MALKRKSRQTLPATPKNLALDTQRKKDFEMAFENWEKQFKAALKKSPGCKDLEIYLKQIRPMVMRPSYGPYFVPVGHKRSGRKS